MNTQTATNTAITPYVINATELEKFGLRQEDESEIQAVAERIDASNPDTVY
ncbi:TPA: toxic anion resistance protein, partial [Escherichia coli]|nr:toxic anion resistance protein [Escherichia coli]